MAGKWHLGKKKPSLPASRGFERSIALMESGADNWEKKTYLPLYDDVTFYEGFEKPYKAAKAARKELAKVRSWQKKEKILRKLLHANAVLKSFENNITGRRPKIIYKEK